MEMPSDPHLGRMIRGYRLETLLHRGKLTATYLARTEECWLESELHITIFSLPESFSEQAKEAFKERFIYESRQLMKLRHPALFPLYGYGEEGGSLYLLRPRLEASMTLAQQLQSQKRWSPADTFALLAPLCSALDYLHHKGIVHQFLSPSAILVLDNGSAQIGELGQSQLVRLDDLAEPVGSLPSHLQDIYGESLGAPEYLAPEVIRGGNANVRSDIYSLGIMLFQLLSGELPFTGKTYIDVVNKHLQKPLPSLHEIAPDIPVSLELIVNRALQRQTKERFATAGEFINSFSHVIDERLYRPVTTGISTVIEQMRSLPSSTSVSINDDLYTKPAVQQRLSGQQRQTATQSPAAKKQITEAQRQTAIQSPVAKKQPTEAQQQLPLHANPLPHTLQEQKALKNQLADASMSPPAEHLPSEQLPQQIVSRPRTLQEQKALKNQQQRSIAVPATAGREVQRGPEHQTRSDIAPRVQNEPRTTPPLKQQRDTAPLTVQEPQKLLQHIQQTGNATKKPPVDHSTHADMERMADHLKRMRERLQKKPAAIRPGESRSRPETQDW